VLDGESAVALNNHTRYSHAMSTVQEIQHAVSHLPQEDLAAFRIWFVEFDAALWDRQFEADVAAGCLDQFADEALQDLREGRCADL
jgi:hypothetical protein